MGIRPSLTGVCAAVVVCGLLAGCAPAGSGPSDRAESSEAPRASSGAASASAGVLPHSGAPKVANSLPRSVVSGSPCDALTPTQVEAALGKVVSGDQRDLPIGPICSWARAERQSQISIAYATKTGEGLSAEYANTQPQSKVWRPLPLIQGFPAVAFSDGQEDLCTVSVGIADDLSVDLTGTLGTSKRGDVDPCEPAAFTADLVVTTLRQRAGE